MGHAYGAISKTFGSSPVLGFNGQRRSTEISAFSQTAQFWEYNGDVGRRWNLDPVVREFESQYVCFSGNPILNVDPFGDSDSTYKTPGGGAVITDDPNPEIFDGKAYKVGNATVQPAKGTLRSFTVTGDNVANGAARFVAQFNTKTGEFTGYGWDKKPSYTYENFIDDARRDLAEQYANADNPTYQHYNNRADALKSAVNLSLSVVLPNPILKYGTAAANASKTIINAGETNRFGIPKFYTYVTQGKSIFVSPHALKHLEELGENGSKLGPEYLKLIGQTFQKSLQSAIDDVLSRGALKFDTPYFSGGNKIIFGAPRTAEELPAVIHFSSVH